MPSPIYATNADVAAYLTTESPIDNVDAVSLLRTASMLVRRATRRDRYEIELATGLPKNADKAEAMKNATIAQALAWNKLRIDPVAGAAGQTAPVTSKSLGGASFSYGSLSVATQDTLDALAGGQTLSTLAVAHLRDGGLMSDLVQVNGGAVNAHVVFSPLASTGTFPEYIQP
ncbi:hypothetical protein [Curtobacterium phage Parvaparticeps]|nr:hypothetical protein [Curtobacterium phage Parvaparticeps]